MFKKSKKYFGRMGTDNGTRRVLGRGLGYDQNGGYGASDNSNNRGVKEQYRGQPD